MGKLKHDHTLNSDLPLNIELAKKYQLPPLVIAYIRSALMRQDSKYNRKSLIEHIMLENPTRKKEIGQLEQRFDLKPSDDKRKQIQSLEAKYQTRDIALLVLNTVSDSDLEDILQPLKQADTITKDMPV